MVSIGIYCFIDWSVTNPGNFLAGLRIRANGWHSAPVTLEQLKYLANMRIDEYGNNFIDPAGWEKEWTLYNHTCARRYQFLQNWKFWAEQLLDISVDLPRQINEILKRHKKLQRLKKRKFHVNFNKIFPKIKKYQTKLYKTYYKTVRHKALEKEIISSLNLSEKNLLGSDLKMATGDCPICGHRDFAAFFQRNHKFLKARCFRGSCDLNGNGRGIYGVKALKLLGFADKFTEVKEDLEKITQKDLPYLILPLEDLRVIQKRLVRRFFNGNKNLILLTGTGAGKTQEIIDGLQTVHDLTKTRINCIAVPNHALAAEYAQRLKGAFRIIRPKIPSNFDTISNHQKNSLCKSPQKIVKVRSLGLSDQIVCATCDHHPSRQRDSSTHDCCPWYAQFQDIRPQETIIITHHLLPMVSKVLASRCAPQISTLVIDEASHYSKVAIIRFDWDELKQDLLPFSNIEEVNDLIVKFEKMWSEARGVCKKNEEVEISPDLPGYPSNIAKQALSTILGCFVDFADSNVRSEEILAIRQAIEHADFSDIDLKKIHKTIGKLCLRNELNFNVFKVLFSIATEKATIFADNKTMKFRWLDPLKDVNFEKVALLDATALEMELKVYFPFLDGDEYLLFKAWPKLKGKILHLKSAAGNRVSELMQKELKLSNPSKIARAGWASLEICTKLLMSQEFDFISRKSLADALPSISFGHKLNIINIGYHFGGIRGLNKFKSKNLVIFNPPIEPPYEILERSRILFRDLEKRTIFEGWAVVSELLQELGRNRALYTSPEARAIIICKTWPCWLTPIIGYPAAVIHNPLSGTRGGEIPFKSMLACLNQGAWKIGEDAKKLNIFLENYKKALTKIIKSLPKRKKRNYSKNLGNYLRTVLRNNIDLPVLRSHWQTTIKIQSVSDLPTFDRRSFKLVNSRRQEAGNEFEIGDKPPPKLRQFRSLVDKYDLAMVFGQ